MKTGNSVLFGDRLRTSLVRSAAAGLLRAFTFLTADFSTGTDRASLFAAAICLRSAFRVVFQSAVAHAAGVLAGQLVRPTVALFTLVNDVVAAKF